MGKCIRYWRGMIFQGRSGEKKSNVDPVSLSCYIHPPEATPCVLCPLSLPPPLSSLSAIQQSIFQFDFDRTADEFASTRPGGVPTPTHDVTSGILLLYRNYPATEIVSQSHVPFGNFWRQNWILQYIGNHKRRKFGLASQCSKITI